MLCSVALISRNINNFRRAVSLIEARDLAYPRAEIMRESYTYNMYLSRSRSQYCTLITKRIIQRRISLVYSVHLVYTNPYYLRLGRPIKHSEANLCARFSLAMPIPIVIFHSTVVISE